MMRWQKKVKGERDGYKGNQGDERFEDGVIRGRGMRDDRMRMKTQGEERTEGKEQGRTKIVI